MSEPIKEVSVSFTRRYKQVEHTCPVCGAVFQASPLAVYDKEACRYKRQWERRSEQVNTQRREQRQELRQQRHEAHQRRREEHRQQRQQRRQEHRELRQQRRKHPQREAQP